MSAVSLYGSENGGTSGQQVVYVDLNAPGAGGPSAHLFEYTLNTPLPLLEVGYGIFNDDLTFPVAFASVQGLVDGFAGAAVNTAQPSENAIVNLEGQGLYEGVYIDPANLTNSFVVLNVGGQQQVISAGLVGDQLPGITTVLGSEPFPFGYAAVNGVADAGAGIHPGTDGIVAGSGGVNLAGLTGGYAGGYFDSNTTSGHVVLNVVDVEGVTVYGGDSNSGIVLGGLTDALSEGGLPASSSSSSDSLTFGSGLDSVASLGNATAAGLSGPVASLGVDSIVATVADAVPVAGASDLFSAQSSSSAFALGADSLSAVQVVGDFASTPVAAATDVVTTVADTASSVVSLDSGLTTIQVTGLVGKFTGGH